MSNTIIGQPYTQNGHTFVAATARHSVVEKFAFTEIYEDKNTKGDQRVRSGNHSTKFADSVRNKRTTRPQSLVCTLIGGKVEPLDVGNVKLVKITFPSDTGRFLRFHDGQHGLDALGMCPEQAADWDWNLSINLSADERVMKHLHININQYGKKADKAITFYQQYEMDAVEPWEKVIGAVYDTLKDRIGSVVYNRVKCRHNQFKRGRGSIASPLGFNDFVKRARGLYSVKAWSRLSETDRIEIVDAYYTQWRRLLPDIWKDDAAYMLSDKMGLKLMTSIMAQVLDRSADQFSMLTVSGVIATMESLIAKSDDKAWRKFWMSTSDRYSFKSERENSKELARMLGFNEKKGPRRFVGGEK